MNFRFLIFVTLLAGCTTTGDWNEDSLFFDKNKANARLAVMEQHLRQIQSDTATARKQSLRLEGELAEARSNHSSQIAQVRQIKSEIAPLEDESSRLARELAAIPDSPGNENARKRQELDLQISLLKSSIARLRAELALILATR